MARTLEEIAYEAGRHALADQESLVAGIRQRTGTLRAAQLEGGSPPPSWPPAPRPAPAKP